MQTLSLHWMCKCVFVVAHVFCTIAGGLWACLRFLVGSVFSESTTRDSPWRSETEKTRPYEGRGKKGEGRKTGGERGRRIASVLAMQPNIDDGMP